MIILVETIKLPKAFRLFDRAFACRKKEIKEGIFKYYNIITGEEVQGIPISRKVRTYPKYSP